MSFESRAVTVESPETGISPARAARRIALVIPVVHPQGRKVRDYGIVEAILKETLASIAAQEGVDARVVVVCHRRPAWHERMSSAVTFLCVGDHPGFSANRNHVHIDKGMKYLVGIWFALRAHNPGLVMPMDGDDFLRSDLSRLLFQRSESATVIDAFMLTGGYHAALRSHANGFDLNAAFKIRHFDRTCGSCRVFHAAVLRKKLHDFLPALDRLAIEEMVGADGQLHRAFLDMVVTNTDPIVGEEDSLIRLLGRHVGQRPYFSFANVNETLVAKGCGHGNHDGPRAGEIHWHRIRKVFPNERFLDGFGLSSSPGVTSKPRLSLQTRGWVSALYNCVLHKTNRLWR